MSKFPGRLRELRKSRRISQQELSKHLNFGYTAIANYESGRNEPSIDTLIQIAEFFDVTVDYLIGISDFPINDNGLLMNEIELLGDFRKLDDRDKKVVIELVKVMLI